MQQMEDVMSLVHPSRKRPGKKSSITYSCSWMTATNFTWGGTLLPAPPQSLSEGVHWEEEGTNALVKLKGQSFG